MSQKSLGHQLGLTFSQVQKYEKGTNRIGAGRLHLLATVLEVPVQYFFEGLGDSKVTRLGSGFASAERGELAVLDDAFASIRRPRHAAVAARSDLLARGIGGPVRQADPSRRLIRRRTHQAQRSAAVCTGASQSAVISSSSRVSVTDTPAISSEVQ